MKVTTLLAVFGLCATNVLGAPTEDATIQIPFDKVTLVLAGFGGSCKDFALDGPIFYATCGSGGGQNYRTALNLSKFTSHIRMPVYMANFVP